MVLQHMIQRKNVNLVDPACSTNCDEFMYDFYKPLLRKVVKVFLE